MTKEQLSRIVSLSVSSSINWVNPEREGRGDIKQFSSSKFFC